MTSRLRPGQCTNRVPTPVEGHTFNTWANCQNDAEPGKTLCATCAVGRCEKHPAFQADYCPDCGTAAKL